MTPGGHKALEIGGDLQRERRREEDDVPLPHLQQACLAWALLRPSIPVCPPDPPPTSALGPGPSLSPILPVYPHDAIPI